MRVWRATEVKSCVFMRESRGGFESGENDFNTVVGGFTHSEVMDDRSSEPRILEEGRVLRISEGA